VRRDRLAGLGRAAAAGARRRRARGRRPALPADRRRRRGAARGEPAPAGDLELLGRRRSHRSRGGARARHPGGAYPRRARRDDADLAFGLLLAAARRFVETDRYVRDGRWSFEHRWDPEALLGRDVHGATLGIVGLGAIGQALARRASGFGMRVLGWSRTPRNLPGIEDCSFEALLAQAEFVSLHVALTPQTRNLLMPMRSPRCARARS
jgi:hypothetical protein